jgi:hypothetical protein
MGGRHSPYSVPTGPKNQQNGGARNHNNNNGNGNGHNNRQHNKTDGIGYGNGYGTGYGSDNQYQNHNKYNNFNDHAHNYGHGNGSINSNLNRNAYPNSNYHGRHFNPNYKGKNFIPNFHGRQSSTADSRNADFNSNFQRPHGGSVLGVHGGRVADARSGDRGNQLDGANPPPKGPRNNRRRNRNNAYLSLPAKFNEALSDADIFMPEAPSDEPNDIEMPDAPPLLVDPVSEFYQAASMLKEEILTFLQRIEAFNAGAQMLQQTVSYPIASNTFNPLNPFPFILNPPNPFHEAWSDYHRFAY